MSEILPHAESEISNLQVEGVFEDGTTTLSNIGGIGVIGALTGYSADEHNRLHLVTDDEPLPLLSQPETIKRFGYRFADITSPKHLIVREHFEELAISNNLPVRNFVRGFHVLINGRGRPGLFNYRYTSNGEAYGTYQVREPKPMKGVRIIKRENANLPLYNGRYLSERDSQIIAQYGARAGSVLNALHSALTAERHKLRRETDRALWVTAHTLTEQLDKK
jgi:hypothetical protein